MVGRALFPWQNLTSLCTAYRICWRTNNFELFIPLRLYFDPLYPKGAAALLQSVWPPAPTAATIPPTTYVHRSGTWLIARSCDEIIMNGRFLKQSCFKKHYCEKYIARKMYVETTKLFIMIKHRPPKVLLFVQAFHLLFVPTCVCRVCTD